MANKHRGTDRFAELLRLMTEPGKPAVCAANDHVLAGGLGAGALNMEFAEQRQDEQTISYDQLVKTFTEEGLL